MKFSSHILLLLSLVMTSNLMGAIQSARAQVMSPDQRLNNQPLSEPQVTAADMQQAIAKLRELIVLMRDQRVQSELSGLIQDGGRLMQDLSKTLQHSQPATPK